MKHSVYEKLTCYCRLSFYVNYSESRRSEPYWQHAGTRGKQTQSNYEWNYGIYAY